MEQRQHVQHVRQGAARQRQRQQQITRALDDGQRRALGRVGADGVCVVRMQVQDGVEEVEQRLQRLHQLRVERVAAMPQRQQPLLFQHFRPHAEQLHHALRIPQRQRRLSAEVHNQRAHTHHRKATDGRQLLPHWLRQRGGWQWGGGAGGGDEEVGYAVRFPPVPLPLRLSDDGVVQAPQPLLGCAEVLFDGHHRAPTHLRVVREAADGIHEVAAEGAIEDARLGGRGRGGKDGGGGGGVER